MGLNKTVLLKRINNDLNDLEEKTDCLIEEIPTESFPKIYKIKLDRVQSFIAPDVEVSKQEFELYLSEEYPYERPTVKWQTDIFHPNIVPPSEGGRVCVRALDVWDFDSNLSTFVQAITDLVNNPNPYDPLGAPTCVKAAEWFLSRR